MKLMFFETWLIQLNLFLWTSFQYDSKNWTFLTWFTELILTVWLREFNFWIKKSYWRKELKLTSWIWRKELNLTSWIWRKELKLSSWIWRQELNLISWIWRKELNLLFLEYDSKNCFFLLICLKDLNFLFWLKELIFLNMTQRIEFLKYDSKELNLLFFWNVTQKNWIFFFSDYDSKELNLFLWNMTLKRIELFITIWLNALNHFFCFEYDSKNWTFVSITQGFFFEYFVFFTKKLTHRIEPFLNMTYRIEPFFWKYESKIWTSFW